MPTLKIGMLVVTAYPSKRWCQIQEVFRHGGDTLYHARWIDFKTGLPLVCPDVGCSGTHTCPLHGTSAKAVYFDIAPKKDIEFYVNEGMLNQDLAAEALKLLTA